MPAATAPPSWASAGFGVTVTAKAKQAMAATVMTFIMVWFFLNLGERPKLNR